MGSPMSENLIKAGTTSPATPWSRTSSTASPPPAAPPAGSIAEAVKDADVVITMVPASPQVEAIAYGPDGILENARPGALLIDMSSITPQTSVDLAKAAAGQGHPRPGRPRVRR